MIKLSFPILTVIMVMMIHYRDAMAADTVYATDRLEAIARQTGVDNILDESTCRDTVVEIRWRDMMLSIRCDSGKVKHIGRKIFSSTTCSEMPSPVYEFIERLALEHKLGIGEESMEEVSLEGCSFDSMVRYASDSTLNLNIRHYGGKVYEMTWEQDGKTLCRLSFPSSFKLLKGIEMLEYQRRLPGLMMSVLDANIAGNSVRDTSGLEQRSDGVLVRQGVRSLKELVSNDTYFICSDDTVKPLIAARFPVESIRNLWNIKSLSAPYTANLKIHEYNRKSTSLSVPLSQLLTFFESEECIPFVGVMDYDAETGDITALVEMTNKPYSYMHVLKVRMNISQLDTPGGEIDVDWLSYIPTHHLVRKID